MLGPLVHADLTGCDESEARERLLARVKKALDASYRAKPDSRPGFPGGASRQVPKSPAFPPMRAETRRVPTTGRAQASLPTAARPAGRLTRNHLLLVGAAGAVVVLMLLFLGLQGRRITATNSAATGGNITGQLRHRSTAVRPGPSLEQAHRRGSVPSGGAGRWHALARGRPRRPGGGQLLGRDRR